MASPKSSIYLQFSNYAKSGACGREKRFLSDINTSAVSTAGHFDEFARVYETFWIKGVFLAFYIALLVFLVISF